MVVQCESICVVPVGFWCEVSRRNMQTGAHSPDEHIEYSGKESDAEHKYHHR